MDSGLPCCALYDGGIKTNLHGESSIKRLFACGEVSSTGVHGANRLASNSLSEAVVYGSRIVNQIRSLPKRSSDIPAVSFRLGRTEGPFQAMVEKRLKLQKVMVRYAGLCRSRDTLLRAQEELGRQLPLFQALLSKREEYEFANLLTASLLVVQGALHREESRGAHFREDYPSGMILPGRSILFIPGIKE